MLKRGEGANVIDTRDIRQGRLIPAGGYCDQPYVVKTADGAWLVSVTCGRTHEGEPGETVMTMRSRDCGRIWEDAVELEPANGPEAAYSVLLATPSGRVYCFYNHNTDNFRFFDTPRSGRYYRVDSAGHYVFRYSDDCGKSWSASRYEVPQRMFDIDAANYHRGEVKYFWNVGKPFVLDGKAYVPIHKIGEFGRPGGYVTSEGALLCSNNILTERDPNRIVWETLPEGTVGLRAPENAGNVAEEQSMVALSDGSVYCVYRTVSGHPAHAVSRDGGRHFSPPDYLRYPDGRPFKHPRAANFVWKCANGRYLYWFHNNGTQGYENRNPVWVCGGVETDAPEGRSIAWSQPEILFYDADPTCRMSYPDMLEDGGIYYFTETQKSVARTHAVEPEFFETIWAGLSEAKPLPKEECWQAASHAEPFVRIPPFYKSDPSVTAGGQVPQNNGFTLALDYGGLTADTVLFSTRRPDGAGMELRYSDGQFAFTFSDGQTACLAESAEERIPPDGRLYLTVDSGPRIVWFAFGGRFSDGGAVRPFGWQRFSPNLLEVNGADTLKTHGCVRRFRLARRALTVAECVMDDRYFLKNNREESEI